MLLLTKGYLDFCFSFSLEQLMSIPTSVTSKTTTLIDHVLTKSSRKVRQCGAIELSISDHDLVYYTRKTSSLKPYKHNDISVRSMKNYTKEKLFELLRKTHFPDHTTFTCLNKAYQGFIFKLSELADLLCPTNKLRLKANAKPWIDSERISAICRRDKLFKKYKKSGLEIDKDHFRLAKMAFQKDISRKKKSFFQEKIEKNANNSTELWKALKSLGMKSSKVYQSKIAFI